MSGGSGQTAALSKLFDRYRGLQLLSSSFAVVLADAYAGVEEAAGSPDTIGVEGSMRYLGDLGVNLDEVVVLAVLGELQAPTMGEFSREGFIQGWKTYRYSLLLHSPSASLGC